MSLPDTLRQQVEEAITHNVGSDSGDLFGTDEAIKAVCEAFESWLAQRDHPAYELRNPREDA